MRKKLIVSATLMLGAILVPSASMAEREMPDSVHSLQEVSVTAIKQGLMSTGDAVASTVVGARQIERLNIVSMKQVSEIAPNFYIPEYGSRMTSSVYVRGLGARIDQPAVGLNVDNVPILNKDNYDFDLVDIARIEVLRGPQSTLYGRNTMGGLINIYTLSPMRYSGVRSTFEYASGNTWKVSAGLYRRLKPELAMSVTASMMSSDGFFRNRYNGCKIDGEKQGAVRWRTVWHQKSGAIVDNVASVTVTRQGGYPYAQAVTGVIDYNDTCFYRRTGVTDGLTVKWRMGDVSVSSITSAQYIDDNMTLDQDFTAYDYFTLTQKRKEWALTQDIIARGSVGCYDWLGGCFGFYKHGDMHAPVTFKEYGIDQLIIKHRNEMNPRHPIAWDDEQFVLGSHFTTPVWGVAVYHESTYAQGDWTFSAGLRLDYEHSALSYRSFCNTSYTIMDTSSGVAVPMRRVDLQVDDPGSLDRDFVQFLPKVSASWRVPGWNGSSVYASVSKGYKSGGYNTQMFSDVLQQRIMQVMGLGMTYNVDQIISYRPEKSWNYEIGAHLMSADGRVSASAALFYIDCRDQQLTMFPEGTTTGRIMANAGRTRSYGAEAATAWRVLPGFDLNVSYGLTDARFVKFTSGKTDYAGKRIPYAPRNTLFVGANYRHDVNRAVVCAVSANVNVRGLGRIYWDEANSVDQPFYAQLGASVSVEFNKFTVDLWGENLTGCNFDTFYFVSIGNSFMQRGKPRRIGATVRFNFQTE